MSNSSSFSFLGEWSAGAEFDSRRIYRYALWRIWNRSRPVLIFVMLNPSTADEQTLDATVSKCVSWARDWGHGGLWVLNAFALRSTDPRVLYRHHDPVGPQNDVAIRLTLKQNPDARVVVGWGRHAVKLKRQRRMLELMEDRDLYCLGVNIDGSPEHPLYIAKETQPKLYRGRGVGFEAA